METPSDKANFVRELLMLWRDKSMPDHIDGLCDKIRRGDVTIEDGDEARFSFVVKVKIGDGKLLPYSSFYIKRQARYTN